MPSTGLELIVLYESAEKAGFCGYLRALSSDMMEPKG